MLLSWGYVCEICPFLALTGALYIAMCHWTCKSVFQTNLKAREGLIDLPYIVYFKTYDNDDESNYSEDKKWSLPQKY